MKKNLKICSPQLGMDPNSSLGGEVYDHFTLKGFCERNFKVYVYLPRNKHYDRNIKNLDVNYSLFKQVVPPVIFSFICLPYLFKTYSQKKFDVLRIHSPSFLGLAGIIFHHFYPKVPIITSAVSPQKSKYLSRIEKGILKISTKIFVQSEYMKSQIHKLYKIEKSRIAVTYGGHIGAITKNKVTPKELKLISKDEKVILFMGLIIKRKNPLFLVDVFSEIAKKNKRIKFVFIGDGDQKNNLVEKLKKEKIFDRCVLLNSAYGSNKKYWLDRMDIFVLPSKDEGFGLTLTEAMSSSKPVVVSDIAPFKEIIRNGEDGYTLKLEKSVWIKTIQNLLTNSIFRKKIGKSAKNKVDKYFNWQKTYDLNSKIVKSIIN